MRADIVPGAAFRAGSQSPMVAPGEWEVTGPLTLTLMASRNGNGTGRVYSVSSNEPGNSRKQFFRVNDRDGAAR